MRYTVGYEEPLREEGAKIVGPWRVKPWYIFWRRKGFRRSVYAPMNIGGGWDGWEYRDEYGQRYN